MAGVVVPPGPLLEKIVPLIRRAPQLQLQEAHLACYLIIPGKRSDPAV
jgi:hypothetical protein